MFKKLFKKDETEIIWEKFKGNRLLSIISINPLIIRLIFDNIAQNIIPKKIT